MLVNHGFAFYLTLAVVITGIIVLCDKLFWNRKRLLTNRKMPVLVDYARSLFPVLLVVLLIRSFLVQLYRVPTGSLEPTVLPGDWILVNQYKYGLHLPITNTKILSVTDPKRGDIVLFYYPPDVQQIFVKRLIGLPGDHIVYKNKVLTVNGKEATQKFITKDIDYGDAPGEARNVNRYQEDLLGIKHDIFVQPQGGEIENYDTIVPEHSYFMVGDNRDNSADSRAWGFVPEANIIGKAEYIIFNWDPVHHRFRWNRVGNKL